MSNMLVTVILQCSVLLMVTATLKCSAPYGHCHTAVFSVPFSHSLCSLPPLCRDNERALSSYSLTSKRRSSQSLLPFQHSAVPKILQWMSTAI